MHPQIGDKRKLSIAVLVGSADAHPTVYSAAVRLQQAREDVISSLSSHGQELPSQLLPPDCVQAENNFFLCSHQGIRVHPRPACYSHLVAIQARYHIINMDHNLDNANVFYEIIEKAPKFMIPAKMSCILRRNICTIIKGKVIILLINYYLIINVPLVRLAEIQSLGNSGINRGQDLCRSSLGMLVRMVRGGANQTKS